MNWWRRLRGFSLKRKLAEAYCRRHATQLAAWNCPGGGVVVRIETGMFYCFERDGRPFFDHQPTVHFPWYMKRKALFNYLEDWGGVDVPEDLEAVNRVLWWREKLQLYREGKL